MRGVRNVLIVIALVVLFVGCTGGRRTSNGIAANDNFRVGTQGLIITLDPNTPPPRIYDFQELNILAEVTNAGAHDLEGSGFDRLYISGFDRNVILNDVTGQGIPLDGRSIGPLEGRNAFSNGQSNVFQFSGIPAKDLKNPFPANIMLTTCYQYKTTAQVPVCIDPDPFTTSSIPKVCTPTSVNAGTQGAPIAVGQIGVQPSRSRTRFALQISNVGGGEPFRPTVGTFPRCNPNSPDGLRFDEVDYVRLLKVEIDNVNLRCEPLVENQYVRLINGRATIFCDYNSARSGVATVPLTVELDYGYRQNVLRNVLIVPDNP